MSTFYDVITTRLASSVSSKNICDIISIDTGVSDVQDGLMTGIQQPWLDWHLLHDMMERPLFQASTLHLGLNYKDSVPQSEVDEALVYLIQALPGCAARGKFRFEHTSVLRKRYAMYF